MTYWEQIEWQVRGLTTRVVGALDAGIAGELAAPVARVARSLLCPSSIGCSTGSARRPAAGARSRAEPSPPPSTRCSPRSAAGATLSQKTLWTLASTPGVTTVLVGMRRPAYVEDATGILGWPPLADARPVYEALRSLRLPGV